MSLRRRHVSLLIAGLAVLAACRAPEGARQAGKVSAAVGSLSPSSETAARVVPIHDRTDIRVAARAADGSLWGVGWAGEAAVFCWRDDGWKKIESAAGLPGNVIALVADPAHPDAVLSLWAGRPQTSGDLSSLHVYRHAPGRERVMLASFANPTAKENGERGLSPAIAADAAGDVWLSFSAPFLLRVPAAGGEPLRVDLPREWFAAVTGTSRSPSELLLLRFTPDATPGDGWLWSVIDEGRPSRRDALFRPVRLEGGRALPMPAIEGLPAAGRVTCLVADGPKRAIWAIEDGGLWDVDLGAGRATARVSPPGAWRILDFSRPADGVEVALTVAPRRGKDRLVGEIWIRSGGGAWRSAGPSGDERASTPGAGGWAVRPRSWARADDLLIGAGFNSGLLAIRPADETPRVRTLGWRQGIYAVQTKEVFPLPEGRLLVQGDSAVAAPVATWRAAWERAGAAGAVPTVTVLERMPIRASDGRLWFLVSSGRGSPLVRHWDGGKWQEWPLPPEREWWPEEALHVEESGRAVVFGDGPKQPAWERDEGVEGGWRRFESMFDWLAARADSGEAIAVAQRGREGFSSRPVFGPRGGVLIGASGSLWLRREGAWRMFTTRELGYTPWRYGFDEKGEPWFASQRERRRLLPDGAIGEPEPWRDPGERNWSTFAENRPAWLNAWFEGRRVDSVHPDALGVWWILTAGELWSAREGEFARVFADDEPSPFRAGGRSIFFGVALDERGHRLFLGNAFILLPTLPAEVARVEWLSTDEPTDRVGKVTGGRRAEWRLNAGPWRPAREGRVELLEMPPGKHRVEVRGEDARFSPIEAVEVMLTLDYDEQARVGRLLEWLQDERRRGEAVMRLARRGAGVEARLRAELARERDERRAWWLRAALQAIEDERSREGGGASGKIP
jgi:hypothetical protein